jgi:hypothetical protein
MHRRLKILASQRDTSMTALIIHAIEEILKDERDARTG